MKFNFADIKARDPEWGDWKWQFRNALKTKSDFQSCFELSSSEANAFDGGSEVFRTQATPYYSKLIGDDLSDPIRKMIIPTEDELTSKYQEQYDPLGERKPINRKTDRLIHRYPDRALLLVTDLCSVYCRFCTRKNFTASDQVAITSAQLEEAVAYVSSKSGIREIILSGGDPLTVSDSLLEKVITSFRQIEHIEIIRIATRMPVVCPMRITPKLVSIFKKNKPVFLLTHFNHPAEITKQSAAAMELLVDHGVPCFNQMVLLNGINNHPAIVQALSRRLLFLRVKPYYMFQCDPSEGTDHLRNSIDNSLEIQKELWGKLSGLAMPQYIVDIPDGGGKAGFTPNYEVSKEGSQRTFVGWDGIKSSYLSPNDSDLRLPADVNNYLTEWDELQCSKQ